jgi:hypothetical protein
LPDFEQLFPGRFLKKTDLARPTVVRITEVVSSEGLLVVEEDDNSGKPKKPEKPKGIMRIKYAPDSLGAYKGSEVILCKTNAALIAAALGERDFDKWAGHTVTLYNCPDVWFGGKKTGGIRVHGSPEMKKPTTIEIKMPRKKAVEKYELVPTPVPTTRAAGNGAQRAAGAQQQQPAATTPPPGDSSRAAVDATQLPDQPPPDDEPDQGPDA